MRIMLFFLGDITYNPLQGPALKHGPAADWTRPHGAPRPTTMPRRSCGAAALDTVSNRAGAFGDGHRQRQDTHGDRPGPERVPLRGHDAWYSRSDTSALKHLSRQIHSLNVKKAKRP